LPKVEVLIDYATNRIKNQEQYYQMNGSTGGGKFTSLDELTKGRMITDFLHLFRKPETNRVYMKELET